MTHWFNNNLPVFFKDNYKRYKWIAGQVIYVWKDHVYRQLSSYKVGLHIVSVCTCSSIQKKGDMGYSNFVYLYHKL